MVVKIAAIIVLVFVSSRFFCALFLINMPWSAWRRKFAGDRLRIEVAAARVKSCILEPLILIPLVGKALGWW